MTKYRKFFGVHLASDVSHSTPPIERNFDLFSSVPVLTSEEMYCALRKLTSDVGLFPLLCRISASPAKADRFMKRRLTPSLISTAAFDLLSTKAVICERPVRQRAPPGGPFRFVRFTNRTTEKSAVGGGTATCYGAVVVYQSTWCCQTVSAQTQPRSQSCRTDIWLVGWCVGSSYRWELRNPVRIKLRVQVASRCWGKVRYNIA